jgi:hypothetical protein
MQNTVVVEEEEGFSLVQVAMEAVPSLRLAAVEVEVVRMKVMLGMGVPGDLIYQEAVVPVKVLA